MNSKTIVRRLLSTIYLSIIVGCTCGYSADKDRRLIDRYKINNAEKSFRFESSFLPPAGYFGEMMIEIPQVEIEKSDIWNVTHEFTDGYLIFSSTYQQRQCEHDASNEASPFYAQKFAFGGCQSDKKFELYIRKDSLAVLGWLYVQDDRKMLWERCQTIDFEKLPRAEWRSSPKLKKISGHYI